MKALASGVALLGVFVAVGSESPNAGVGVIESGWRSPTAVSSEALTAVVRQYCWVCHNDALLTGNLSLEGFDVDAAYERAETAERMVRKLRAGMMPPPNAPRPAADTLRALVETLERVVDGAAAADPNPGNRRFQRLNQAEYERVIEDLLGLEIDAGNWLPSDTYLGSFDNLSAAQGLSTTLLEAYLRAAAEISRLAVGNSGAQPSTTTYKQALEASQHAWDHIEGAPYGTRGGVVATHDFPVDGEYVFTVETFLGRGTAFEDVDISIDGEGVALLAIEHNGVSSVPIRTEPTFVRGGQRRVSASFIKKVEGPYEDRLSPHEWSLAGGTDSDNWANYGITVLPHLRHMQISGPINPAGVSETASRKKVFRCRPATPIEERSCAESIISRLGSQAFRRPLTSEEMAGLVSFYESGGEEGGFEVGVRTALEAILASPSFVFRFEKAPAGVQTGQTYLLNNLDLASRLSFFLWGRLPDEELVEFASQGKLTLPGGIEQQVERMLADPRSEALATRFASQWLRLQDLEKIQPDPYLYPDYSRQLASAMRRETELFFYDIVRHDRSILDLFTADYTYVNERLARYYGIPSWGSTEFQRVQQPDEHRRGVLGQSSILVLTSLPDRTSPVLRGKWVMEVLLGTPPPPPPPNVPTLEETDETEGGVFLTTRQRMEKHRANPVCNACHQFMDPIGLALDNFDVGAQWRIREKGRPLDTQGTFYDGTPISTPSDLREVLLKRPIPLLRTFTDNLLAYAIGRRVEYFDQPTIRQIVREADANDYRISSFIMGVATSDAFRMKRSELPVAAEAGGAEN